MVHSTKRADVIFTVLFSAFIISFGILIAILPQKSFSDEENRPLSTFPKFSLASLSNREFFSGVSDFYSDQLPLRKNFGYLYAISELALGKREVNGIIICRDGTLVSRSSNTNEEILQSNLEAIPSSDSSVVFLCPPDSASVFSEYITTPIVRSDTADEIYRLSNEFSESISNEPHKYYYRTDHHWTTAGAYAAYFLLCNELEITPYPEDFFVKETPSTNFYGSSFRRSSLPKSMIPPDSIVLYRYASDCELTLDFHNSVARTGGLYDLDALGESDKYRVFLGGNYAHVSIKGSSSEQRKTLLIIKDSFANSLIPFLALHYDLEIIDPRYAGISSAKELVESIEFQKALILCSRDTLAGERAYSVFFNLLHST